ncbi:F-type H+-transporting ATPase subunit b [Pedobacter sp. UYP30]|uniref:F0F1 ATP synthase subunit B family protein n=1 Tax=Pedobacter sp. UYP30 TaxID=1756400 RepID=UPI003395426F
MQINWFTVIAQIINFLVLVWLMKKYLYKPILQAVDEREKKIAAELTDAKTKKNEAKKEQDEFQKKNDTFDSHKKKMMDQATSDTEKERQKLLDQAHKEAADLKLKLEKASKDLQENLNDQLAQQTQQTVFSITKKALAEMASTTLEEQTVQVFVKKIKAINDKDKKQFLKDFHSSSSPISVKSAFDLSDKDQKSIKSAIGSILGDEGKYNFETDSKMISGIELATNSYKLSWSFTAYINSLEKSMETEKNDTRQTVKQ